MTNIQAADLLKDLEQCLDDYCELNDEGKTAFHMAIAALESFGISEQLASAQPEPCEDAVSRRRLLSDLKELTAAWGNYPVMAEQIKGVETAIGYVETIPSAQSEIIRCRDCKHYYYADNRIPQEQRYVCDLDGDRWKPDDYCSFAERMKGEQDG